MLRKAAILGVLSVLGLVLFPVGEGAGMRVYFAFDSLGVPIQTPTVTLSERVGIELPVEGTGLTFCFAGGLGEAIIGSTWSWTYVLHPHLVYDWGWGWVDFGGTYVGGIGWTLHLNFKLYFVGPGDRIMGYPVHPVPFGE